MMMMKSMEDEDVVVEEDDDDMGFNQKPALFFTSCGFSNEELEERIKKNIPPISPEEYIARVQIQAKKIPDIMVSDVDPRKYDNKQTVFVPKVKGIDKAPSTVEPGAQWKADAVDSFIKTRDIFWSLKDSVENGSQAISSQYPKLQFPGYQDQNGWYSFLGIREPSSSLSSTSRKTLFVKPTVNNLMQFDQVRISKSLTHLSKLFGKPETIDLFHKETTLLWIYSLFVGIQVPVPGPILGIIRTLGKHASYARRRLHDMKIPADVETYHALNLIVVIVEDFFKQGDTHEHVINEPSDSPPTKWSGMKKGNKESMDDLYVEE